MLSVKFPKIILIIVGIFVSLCSYAQRNNFSVLKKEPAWLQKVTTLEKKLANRDIQDGYYLHLYERQNNIETKEEYGHYIREIVSDLGVQNGSEITVTYDPSYQQLTFHKVTIWRNNQPLDRLKASQFKVMQNEQERSKFIYSGTYDAYLILDDVRKGDRIEYAYTLKGANPVFFNKYSNTFYFEGESKITNIYFNIVAKKDRALNFKNFNAVPKLKVKEDKGLKVYEWQNQLTKVVVTEDYTPSWYNNFGRVQVSEFSSWKEIVDWSLQLNQYDLSKSAIIIDKIKELKLKANGNAEKYMELATRFVQDEVRYTGIEIGEYSHRPNSPDKVLRQRYGDCKDKSLLLIYLLRGNGTAAHPVYINTFLKDKTKDLLPTTGAFDHAVVLVEFAGKKIWIDPTMSDQAGPIQKNYFPYSANVLVVKHGNDRLEWVKTNAVGKLTSISLLKMPDTLAGSKAELTINSTYTANYADNLRSEISASGIDKLEKDFLEYYDKIYPGIAKVNDLEIIDNKKNNKISLKETYEVEHIWEKDDSVANRYNTYFYADMINGELTALKKPTSVPVALKFPSNIQQIIKVVFPVKFNLDDEKNNINRNAYEFNYSLSYKADTLTFDYSYRSKADELTPNETKQYIKDKTEINTAINYSIYWGGKATENNDWNSTMALTCLFVFLFSTIVSVLIYLKKRPFNLEEIKQAEPIGGWLMVAAIALTISAFMQIAIFSYSDYLSQAVWDDITSNNNGGEFSKKLLFAMEAIVNTFLFVFNLLLINLFFNKRKILPQYLISFHTLSIIFKVLDTIACYAFDVKEVTKSNVTFDVLTTLTGITISIIWILYFLKSKRVKRTFVLTYPNSTWRMALIKEMSTEINVPYPSNLGQSIQEVHQKNDEPQEN